MELKGFFQVLLNRKWLLLSIISVAAIAAFLIASQAPPRYVAETRLVAGIVQGENALFTLGSARGAERYEVETRFRNLEEMIQSKQVLMLVSYQLMLHDLRESPAFRDIKPLREAYSQDQLRVALRNFQQHRDSMDMLQPEDELDRVHLQMMKTMGYQPERLQSGLRVARVPGTDYISISFASESGRLSAFVANRLAQEFVRHYLLTNSEMAENTLETVEKLVNDRKAILDQNLQEWQRYHQQQGASGNAQSLTILEDIERLEAAREETSNSIIDAERSIIDAQQGLPFPGRSFFVNQGVTRGVGGETSLLSGRLLSLNQRYVRSGFLRQNLKDSLEAVERMLVNAVFITAQNSLETSGSDIRDLLRQQVRGEVRMFLLQSRLTSIAQEIRRLSVRTGTFDDLELTSSNYGREVAVARDAYLTALHRLNDIRLGLSPTGSSISAVSQVAAAQPPQDPEPSQAVLLALLAGLIAFAIGAGILLLLEYLDESIKLPSRFSAMTGLPLLSPLVRLRSSNLDLVSLFRETQKHQHLEVYKQQLRIIRQEVNTADPVSLMITSSRTGVGKTSFLISLAYSLSLEGKKILLVDTNFHNCSLTAMTDAAPNLQPYLRGDLREELLISPSVFEGIDVIGAETSEASPAEILNPERFEAFLVGLSDRYDHILFEGPGLNDFVGARELTMFAAKILPVFAADAPVGASDKTSIDYLKRYPNKLLGAVLNKVEPRHLAQ